MLTVIAHWGIIKCYIHIIKWPKGLKRVAMFNNKHTNTHVRRNEKKNSILFVVLFIRKDKIRMMRHLDSNQQ